MRDMSRIAGIFCNFTPTPEGFRLAMSALKVGRWFQQLLAMGTPSLARMQVRSLSRSGSFAYRDVGEEREQERKLRLQGCR